MSTLTASCRCGAVELAIDGAPIAQFYCHCDDCQAAHSAAWCELRQDFRGFRVDRIDALQVLPERFNHEPGKTLAELLRRLRECKPPPSDETTLL